MQLSLMIAPVNSPRCHFVLGGGSREKGMNLVPDVRFPSVCREYLLLPLVNNEAVLVNGLAE